MTFIFQTLSHWLESAVNSLFTDTMPSDYVAINTFIKCDPLLVQLLYILSSDGEMLYTILP